MNDELAKVKRETADEWTWEIFAEVSVKSEPKNEGSSETAAEVGVKNETTDQTKTLSATSKWAIWKEEPNLTEETKERLREQAKFREETKPRDILYNSYALFAFERFDAYTAHDILLRTSVGRPDRPNSRLQPRYHEALSIRRGHVDNTVEPDAETRQQLVTFVDTYVEYGQMMTQVDFYNLLEEKDPCLYKEISNYWGHKSAKFIRGNLGERVRIISEYRQPRKIQFLGRHSNISLIPVQPQSSRAHITLDREMLKKIIAERLEVDRDRIRMEKRGEVDGAEKRRFEWNGESFKIKKGKLEENRQTAEKRRLDENGGSFKIKKGRLEVDREGIKMERWEGSGVGSAPKGWEDKLLSIFE